MTRVATALALVLGLAGAAHAEVQVLKLNAKMACPTSDPALFEKVLNNEDGVLSATASYDAKMVVIRYDDAVTDEATLRDAIEAVGLELAPEAGGTEEEERSVDEGLEQM